MAVQSLCRRARASHRGNPYVGWRSPGTAVVGSQVLRIVAELSGGASIHRVAGYPFLFYGCRPADWYEGGNNGYRFDLRFAVEPDEVTRTAAQAAFRDTIAAGSAAEYEGSWEWKGAWATVFVGDRYVDWLDGEDEDDLDGDGAARIFDELWDEVADAVAAVHQVAPLAEVVNRNLREYRDAVAWSAWSVAQQTHPGWPAGEPVASPAPAPADTE